MFGLGGRGQIKHGLSGSIVRLYTHWLMSDLTSLVPQQCSHWLRVRKVGTPVIITINIYIIIQVICFRHLLRPTSVSAINTTEVKWRQFI